MDLVSNFVGSISPSMFGGKTQNVTPSVDLEDNTFSNMLDKQIQKEMEQTQPNFMETLGLPSNLNIEDFINTSQHIAEINTGAPSNTINSIEFNNTDQKNMSTSEFLTFFNSFFDSKPTLTDTSNSGLFEFERKLAATQYNKYSRNVVTDINEFVTDALKMS